MGRIIRKSVFAAVRGLLVVIVFSSAMAWASVGGSISGTIKDPSGRVVAKANVVVREVNTGLSYQSHTDGRGTYTFPVLPVGRYELDVQATGFRGYQRTGITLDTNAALTLDDMLEVGSGAWTVS